MTVREVMMYYKNHKHPFGDPPDLECLVNHAHAHGLYARDGKGHEIAYPSYKALSHDSVVEIGRSYLDSEDFVKLIELIGYPEFVEKAHDDWAACHGEAA